MANLLESLQGYLSPDLISKLSGRLGESEEGISKAMGGILPTISAGLIQKTNDPTAMTSLFNSIKQTDGSYLSNVSNLLPGDAPANAAPQSAGNQFLSGIFGNKLDSLSGLISNFSGIKATSAAALLSIAGPLVLGFLGKKTKEENLKAQGLTSWLTGQKDSIMRALPPGIASALGFSTQPISTPPPIIPPVSTSPPVVRPEPVATPRATVTEPVHRTPPPVKKQSNWLWPLLLGLGAILLAIFALRNCNKKPEVVETPVTTTETTVTKTEVTSPDTTVKTETTTNSKLGAFNKKDLPDGVTLSIPENGIENKLVMFIEDKNKPVDKTTWFSFDRLTFETNSAMIKPESEEQLKNIAEILKAYPKVEIKIGGYTDNTGDAATNLKLSKERANSVKAAFIKDGIVAKRLSAEGYGQEHPVADNATEEGKAQNRRIDVRVTKK